MTIKYKEYTIEPENTHFNLYKDIQKEIMEKGEGMTFNRTGKFKTVQEDMGFGMSFERCVECIIKDTINSKEEVMSLREYIDEYKSLKGKILEEVK